MDYEKITNEFLENTMKKFGLYDVYQEFLDSLVKFDDFSDIPFEDFQKYLENYGE